MSDRRALMGTVSGSGGGDIDWANVTEVTIGANTITKMTEVSAYFSNYTYNYLVLTTAPTTENQVVVGARLAQSGTMNHALRYRGGTIGGTIISGSYDGILVEGTKYCLLSRRDLT